MGLFDKKNATTQLQQDLRSHIAAVCDPNTGESLEQAGFIERIDVSGDVVELSLVFDYPEQSTISALRTDLEQAVAEVDPALRLALITAFVAPQGSVHSGKPFVGARNIIAVASGKGGVGKYSTSVNLALALQAEGARVGLLDADIYGPSQPTMLGCHDQPEQVGEKQLKPVQAHGLATMSIGYLVDEKTAMVWRGPMVTSALMQLLNDTQWPDLDYLIVDMPPGTGDVQLTLAQKVPVAGSVIVTTPQNIALLDAQKAISMFDKVSVPILGVVENMSTHVCSNCGHEEALFGSGGGARIAGEYHVPLLGQLPLNPVIREDLDQGTPTVAQDPDGAIAQSYRRAAIAMSAALGQAVRNSASTGPQIEIEE